MRPRLRPDQQLPPIQPVDQHSGKGSQNKSGNLPGKAHHSQQQRGTREPVYQPTGGNAGHPGADERNALTGKKQPEISVL